MRVTLVLEMAAGDAGALRRRLLGRAGGRVDPLLREGWPVYAVGGALRDLLSGRVPRDLDLVAGTDAGTLARLLPEGRWVGQGLRTFVLPRRGTGRTGLPLLQIGLFEKNLEEELARRDFSVNAMALAIGGRDGLRDPFGGLADLSRGLLRRPDRRRDPFAEDPLRVLRLARFVAERGFSVEEETLGLAEAGLPGLGQMAPERVREELLKLFSGTALRTLSDRLPEGFLGRMFFASGGRVERLSPGEIRSRLARAARIPRTDPLFRLWICLVGGSGPEGSPHSAGSFPAFRRSERRRLSSWSRLEEFLAEGGSGTFAFSCRDRTLILATREDRLEALVAYEARRRSKKERRPFLVWADAMVKELSRPWQEIGGRLTGR